MSDHDEFFAELDREIARELRHGTWPAYIVRALLRHPDCIATKQEVLLSTRHDCERRGRPIPPSFSDTVQAAFQAYNAGSDAYVRQNPDLFYFAGPKGDGKWGLNIDRATAWMAKSGFEMVPSPAA